MYEAPRAMVMTMLAEAARTSDMAQATTTTTRSMDDTPLDEWE